MSDSVWPHRQQPTRLPCPSDSPGKNTGGGCHFLLPCMKVKSECEVAQWCPTLSDPMDCSLPGSSVQGISQQEYWSGLPFPSPGDLPNSGIESMSPVSPALAGFLPLDHMGNPNFVLDPTYIFSLFFLSSQFFSVISKCIQWLNVITVNKVINLHSRYGHL